MSGEVRMPRGLRWECTACGAGCSAFRLGPVEPEVIARLEAEDIGARWAPAADGFVDRQPDGLFLRHVDGHCVFLRDDKLCAVHALLGMDAKPWFCREFPYHTVEDPRGTVLVVRPTCKSFGRTFRTAPEVVASEALTSDAGRNVPRRRFAPAAVEVAPGHTILLDRYMDLEDRLIAAVDDADADPFALLALLRGTVYAELGAEPPARRPEQAHAAEEAILRALRIVMGQVVQQPGGSETQRAFAAEALARIETAHDAAGEPVRLGPDGRAYANLLLRSHLLAKRFVAYGGLAEGLGAWAIGAVVAGRTADDDSSEALGEAWRAWERFEAIEMVTALLRRARPALIDLFLHA